MFNYEKFKILRVPEVNDYAAMQILPSVIPHFPNIASGYVNT